MKLSKGEAIQEVLKWRRIDRRERTINDVADNGLLET